MTVISKISPSKSYRTVNPASFPFLSWFPRQGRPDLYLLQKKERTQASKQASERGMKWGITLL